jgi:hypothetical protein
LNAVLSMPAATPFADSLDGSAVSRAVRRHDDNERFRRHFAALTGLETRAASIESLPTEFLSRTLPSPATLLQRYGSALAARTCNALARYEPGRDEVQFTFRRLLELRGFGLFSLIDLLEAMAKTAEPPPTTPP